VGRLNKFYSRQFKQEAMDLVRVKGYDAARAARELGVPTTTLNMWLKKAGWSRPPEGAVDPDAAATTAPPEDPARLRARVSELERQVRRLETEKEILKKRERNRRLPANATAFFASQSP
jgi:transposase